MIIAEKITIFNKPELFAGYMFYSSKAPEQFNYGEDLNDIKAYADKYGEMMLVCNDHIHMADVKKLGALEVTL